MKQVIQTQGDGTLRVADVPPPALLAGGVLVRTAYSLISAGTERASVDLARKSLVGKAKARPDQVKQVLDSVRTQGLAETYQRVRGRLDQLTALGYSSAGVVIEVGRDVQGLKVGDRVACAGAGYASHAEINYVPANLCVAAPLVPLDEAAFGTVGAIAMQGVRQADLRVGEVVAVVGLGLIGLITVQILKASGCRVVGIEPNAERRELARSLGCDATARPSSEAVSRTEELSGGHGADAAIITAATRSSAPVELAGKVCRSRGRVVMVGATGMEVPRAIYYDKELDFRLSRSYGPGRYDPEYEEKGHDYPLPYVRWTEQRNIQSFLDLVADGKVQLRPLLTHTYPIDSAPAAYDMITAGTEPHLGVVLDYGLEEAEPPQGPPASSKVRVAAEPAATGARTGGVGIGLVGAGSFATNTLIPALKAVPEAALQGVATASGVSARGAAERAGFAYAASDALEVLGDPEVDALVVATRHDTHAELVMAAIEAGKPVFVEKPLALDADELQAIVDAAGETAPTVMVGFNRRFAPTTRELRRFFQETAEPLAMDYRVNAGFLPLTHWLHDPEVGGGRIIGEGCHFVDLLMHVAGAAPVEVYAQALPDGGRYREDNVSAQIRFANGAIGTLHYLANGDRGVPKERLEVSGGGGVAILDDFRRLTLSRGGKATRTGWPWTKQDKGWRDEVRLFVDAVRDHGPSPIPLSESVAVTATTFALVESLRGGAPVRVRVPAAAAPEGRPVESRS